MDTKAEWKYEYITYIELIACFDTYEILFKFTTFVYPSTVENV